MTLHLFIYIYGEVPVTMVYKSDTCMFKILHDSGVDRVFFCPFNHPSFVSPQYLYFVFFVSVAFSRSLDILLDQKHNRANDQRHTIIEKKNRSPGSLGVLQMCSNMSFHDKGQLPRFLWKSSMNHKVLKYPRIMRLISQYDIHIIYYTALYVDWDLQAYKFVQIL
ncbi:hypothetical protein PHYBLDRAFT_59897 [Phycomyces blakesleeanus NRRL 1555(-)]|uniref:Uncharacterized protein n=1 Tax=Phycomyces blakesleeanus (strain ATCC 8743b / DSM 1359 / FGSC 10004 / NBRC 33097 / NRRL 1555) TaxID=763407 RepID=A0A167NNN2_PHYB8|nr:hypothetical protein PHYBLDRAFT_59897 [Phycomyces blakesleeanus NRRL 1555(-)]OAD76359.1 hypothetical protein PHYBLDRAFT_59897 [Phycomyces blakesleeanus NRRL 1555(-)]|eukprot:XP_018294399.1 hypothetical protein PHYBLDRAFT_59897 [Phycomyces blakesleeanus NRRL 1555(-)]